MDGRATQAPHSGGPQNLQPLNIRSYRSLVQSDRPQAIFDRPGYLTAQDFEPVANLVLFQVPHHERGPFRPWTSHMYRNIGMVFLAYYNTHRREAHNQLLRAFIRNTGLYMHTNVHQHTPIEVLNELDGLVQQALAREQQMQQIQQPQRAQSTQTDQPLPQPPLLEVIQVNPPSRYLQQHRQPQAAEERPIHFGTWQTPGLRPFAPEFAIPRSPPPETTFWPFPLEWTSHSRME